MNLHKLTLLLCLLTFTASAQKIRVACIGNSITYGYAIEDREHDSYPAQLQQLLGEDYEVGNFGLSGVTAQKLQAVVRKYRTAQSRLNFLKPLTINLNFIEKLTTLSS